MLGLGRSYICSDFHVFHVMEVGLSVTKKHTSASCLVCADPLLCVRVCVFACIETDQNLILLQVKRVDMGDCLE